MSETRQTAEDIAQLKIDYVRYFEDVPVQKYAAKYVGRTSETIMEWKASDPDFLYRVNQAESKFIKKKLLQTQASFALERLFKDVFAERKEHTGADGESLNSGWSPEAIQKLKDIFNEDNPTDTGTPEST